MCVKDWGSAGGSIVLAYLLTIHLGSSSFAGKRPSGSRFSYCHCTVGTHSTNFGQITSLWGLFLHLNLSLGTLLQGFSRRVSKMAQTLSCTLLAHQCGLSLKTFTVYSHKPFDCQSLITSFSTSRPQFNNMSLMSSWKLNSDIFSYSNLWFMQNMSASNACPSRKTIIAAYSAGAGIPKTSNYHRLGQCLVVPPPDQRKPCGIIKFLGGAFIGAVPELTYSLFLDLLAKEGFLIVAVPHNVTFEHAQAAREVYDKFNSCMDILLSSGLASANLTPNDIQELPVYCVGHSNGALLQLLEGCYFEEEKLQKANVLISFYNKPAADAVPYFEQVGPMAAQFAPLLAAAPFYEMATNISRDALETMLQAAGPMLEQYNPETILSLARFTEQIPSVMNQITQGVSEFKPTPVENRQTVSSSYKIPRNLLVKFNFDSIDETDLIETVLRPRIDAIGGSLAKVELNGTHITPCGQDLNWQVGDLYTPADAVAQGLKGVALNDIKALVKTIANWLKSLN